MTNVWNSVIAIGRCRSILPVVITLDSSTHSSIDLCKLVCVMSLFSLLTMTAFGVQLMSDVCYRRPDVTPDRHAASSPPVRLNSTSGSVAHSLSVASSFLKTRFVVNAEHLCDAREEDGGNATSLPLCLIVVHSRPDEVGKAQRDAIRGTWGSSVRQLDGSGQLDTRVVFLVGRQDSNTSLDPDVAKLRHEGELYGDLVVADFVDTYRNLTIKSLIGLQWARAMCSSANYIIKADDDVYLLVDLLPDVLHRRQRSRLIIDNVNGVEIEENAFIVGSLNVNASVQRQGLWRVDSNQFPAEKFPPYCSGNVYMMTSSAADRLLEASFGNVSFVDPFPLEDVYVTSILAARSGLQCKHDDAFPHWFVGPTGSSVRRMCTGKLVAVHRVDYRRMYDVDRQLHSTPSCQFKRH